MTPEAPARRSPRASSSESCSVPGCASEASRSLSLGEARKAFPGLPDAHRAHLCKDHYRAWKKATKKDRDLRRLGW